ncbi:MAG: energy-coupling factor ABC transporter permease [Candidatus Orphnella occulta]|nr:energy-coupling factor ABC transporter permease [Candidatus Orphnella occulta]
MHVPNSMLQGHICPVTALVGAVGVAIAAIVAFRSKNKPTAARFGAITALIFAAQMINFPILDGTSGHLLGGVLASTLLGTPFGILAVSLVVTIQCLVFSDGGFTVLGANILNMALIGAGLGGVLRMHFLDKVPVRSLLYASRLGLIAWLSVMMAALAVSIELALSGTITFSTVVITMLGAHALIGIGEGLITIATCFAFAQEPANTSKKWSVTVPLIASGVIATMLSPFASGFPDGLEWVAAKYQFLHEAAPTFVSPLPDYSVLSVSNAAISTGLAGLAGVTLTFLVAWAAAKMLTLPEQAKA